MVSNIILTVTNLRKQFFYDLEVPTDVAFEKLKVDMVDTLNGGNPGIMIKAAEVEFLCNKTGKQIRKNETLEEAGVWNGDYLTMIEV